MRLIQVCVITLLTNVALMWGFPPVSEGRLLLMKGATLADGAMDALLLFPDGHVLRSIDVITRSWKIGYADDDLLVYDDSIGTFSLYDENAMLPLSTFAEVYADDLQVFDPSLDGWVGYPELAAGGASLDSLLNNPGTLVLFDPGFGALSLIGDTTPPELAVPPGVTASAVNAQGAVVTFSVSATDNLDPNPVVVCAPASATLFPLGATTVTCTATDVTGNQATASFTVTVVDRTPPVLTCPANVTIEATSASGTTVSYAPASATDNVTAAPILTYSPASGTLFALGTHAASVTATDEAGNSSSCSFTVTVQDATPPVVVPPSALVVPATDAGGTRGSVTPTLAAFLAGGSATDAVDPAPARLTPQVAGVDVDSNTLFPIGTTPVTFRFQDASGNLGAATAGVTVILGTPRLSGAIAAKGIQSPGVLYLDLRLTNTGTGHARNMTLNQILLRVLSGSGTVTYNSALSPALPIAGGSLDIGVFTTIRVYLNVPATVTRFSVTESGTMQDVAGTNLSFSLGQAIIP